MSRHEKHCAKRTAKRVLSQTLGSLRRRMAQFLFRTERGLRLTNTPLWCQLRLSQHHRDITSLPSLP